jgi:hypothetical protein
MRGWICSLHCCWSSPAQSFSGPTPAGLVTTFYCLKFETPNLEGQVPVFISPRNRVVLWYCQALSSPFVASYHSQCYGGGIRTRLPEYMVLNPRTQDTSEPQILQLISCLLHRPSRKGSAIGDIFRI